MLGNGALSGAGRAINRHDHLADPIVGTEKIFVRAHPRFFVFCPPLFLAGAVKPYRLLLPALAPAARAGLRLPRAARASVRTSFLAVPRTRLPPRTLEPAFAAGLLPCPLRWLIGADEDLPLRAPDCTLAEWLCPLPFPLDRAPF